MDLGMIKTKLASGAYSSLLDFHADVKLTFSNAMIYNPPGNNVHLKVDTLAKYFDLRWKTIEKKLLETDAQLLPAKSGPREDMPKPINRVMMDEEKHNLGKQLESLLGEIPIHIIDFLREHRSNGRKCGEDEIDIDIEKWDPEKLRREREELELELWKGLTLCLFMFVMIFVCYCFYTRSRRKRELEREAARQALLQMEKTVEINDNSQFLEDLEMVRSGPAEQLPSSVD